MIDLSPPLKPRPKGARKKSVAERLRSPSEPASIRHGYFHSFDGTKIFYSIEGEGLPLVFCYGLVCSSLHWTYQIEYFRRNYQTIWFDYRGHQNSDVPQDFASLTIPNMAHDLELLLKELKINQAAFLGHSMGVNVLLELYKRCPEKISGMILANGTARRPLETLMHINAFQAGFKLLKRAYDKSPKLFGTLWKLQNSNPIYRRAIALAGFNPYLTPQEDVDLYLNQIAEMDPRILLQMMENYDEQDASAWLHTISCPTLILAGEQDHAIPLEQQELMNQLIPGSELDIIRHGSHCPQMDLPELVNHKIEDFLGKMKYLPTPSHSPNVQST